jgi:hypothetical protein
MVFVGVVGRLRLVGQKVRPKQKHAMQCNVNEQNAMIGRWSKNKRKS